LAPVLITFPERMGKRQARTGAGFLILWSRT
jgi:hypothetical protein